MGSEGDVRQRALGAGSLLKWSAPWGFAVAQHGFGPCDRGSKSYYFLAGSEGDVRQRALGAGSLLKWSAPWRFAVAQHGFGACDRGSKSYYFPAGSEGDVRQRALGAGSLLKWSAPWRFAVAQHCFGPCARGFKTYFSSGLRKSTFLAGSEGDVRQCALGAGSLLKWSAPWGFAVEQHGLGPATAAPKATFLGSEVRQCTLGAGSLLKWSATRVLLWRSTATAPPKATFLAGSIPLMSPSFIFRCFLPGLAARAAAL